MNEFTTNGWILNRLLCSFWTNVLIEVTQDRVKFSLKPLQVFRSDVLWSCDCEFNESDPSQWGQAGATGSKVWAGWSRARRNNQDIELQVYGSQNLGPAGPTEPAQVQPSVKRMRKGSDGGQDMDEDEDEVHINKPGVMRLYTLRLQVRRWAVGGLVGGARS